MQPDIRWLDDPQVFQVNRLPAHSDHTAFAGEEDLAAGKSALAQCLDGTWKFAWSPNAAQRPAEFYRPGYDLSSFGEIAVPMHMEIAGYDRIHYINTMYPWEGQIFRRPAHTFITGEMPGQFSGAEYNPVGSYVREFDLDEGLKGKKVVVRFEGVEQAMYVFCNGAFIGYSEDSFTPAEFDLTDVIREKGNVLCVEVHKRSTAAWLEDQDFFRFSGIFRSVWLYGQPENHIQDMFIHPEVDLQTRSGCVGMELKMSGGSGRVGVVIRKGEKIFAEKEYAAAGELSFRIDMPEAVELWANGNPALYTIEMRVYDASGALCEIVPWNFGFRKIELKDGVMLYNGERLIIKGVNRHEWNAHTGRVVTEEDEIWDVECFHRNNINSVRTCHYPDRLSWYRLCDEQGIYMMAESNLETHGSWQKQGAIEPSWNVPGSCSAWEGAVMDRMISNFETFKNHTSVIFWSLGNESFAGEVLVKANEYFKQADPTRLVHYEGVYNDRPYTDRISDMESQMYSTPEDIAEYLENEPKKPFILCEFMHDMGNSLGGFDSYMDLFRYKMYQGGYIWDYIDQALFVRDEVTGEEVLRYGGDFDDRPADYEFSGNGIVFADRTEKPAMQEVRYFYGKQYE
ncbi:MAG: glycoside hydrolase family 2 TIM barrel-domain containing protein [Eubacteriales bacterium]|nr:glycoside hydrolase family 2 TIM barrel-domain containing protein [Eubacteriales bacterium]